MYIDYDYVIEGLEMNIRKWGIVVFGCWKIYGTWEWGLLSGQCQSNNSDCWESFRVKGCFFGGHQPGD